MIVDNENKIDTELANKFRASDIPKSTTEPRYERICKENDDRREDIKRLSIAITKQTERPFSFTVRE